MKRSDRVMSSRKPNPPMTKEQRASIERRIYGDTVIYGDWSIHYDPPPAPWRGLDYTYTHKDYDGAPDSGDKRCGWAGSVAECKADIDEIEAEAADEGGAS